MKKLILTISLLSLPLVACATNGSSTASTTSEAEAQKDWSQRRDEFVKDSHAKLDRLYKDVQKLETSGHLVKANDARDAKDDAEERRSARHVDQKHVLVGPAAEQIDERHPTHRHRQRQDAAGDRKD